MAYNPFNIFRRNQKVIFAVITVFIMFTFVLSSGLSGGADFFDWLPRLIGSRTNKGDHLCTIDGKKIYQGDLDALNGQRLLANRWMDLAGEQAQENLRRFVAESLPKASPEVRQAVNQVLMMERFLNNPQLAPFAFQQMQQMAAQLAQIVNSPGARNEDKEVARAMQFSLAIGQMRMLTGGRLYFINAPNRNERDRIDFLIWDKKAEQLGIRFTEADVERLVSKEFLGQFKNDVPVRQAMQEMRGFSITAVMKALAAEFRVRAAMAAVIGAGGGRSDSTLTAEPLFTPPYELFDFYREKTSPSIYATVSVPVENFVAAVTGEPTDRELMDLFEKYKADEPNPSKETPGFKEPRKLKIGWLTATGEEPYYQNKAKEWVTRTEWLMSTEAAALAVPLPGVGPGWAAMAVAPMGIKDPLVRREYEDEVVRRHKGTIAIQWDSSRFVTQLLDTSVARPQNLAAAVGGMAGGLLGFGNPYAAAAPLPAGAVAFEQRDRIKAGMPAVLGMVPGFGLEATMLAGAATYVAATPPPLPIEAMRPELIKTATERKARDLVLADMKTLQADVDKITDTGKKKDKATLAAAAAAVAKFAADRGLKTGASADFRDEWAMDDDTGLAPLKEAFRLSPQGNPIAHFGGRFFWTEQGGFGGQPVRTATAGLYKPEFYPSEPSPVVTTFTKPEPVFLTWRTDEAQTRTVPFQEARPKVIAAWKRAKARDLAKAEAENIANAIRQGAGNDPIRIEQDLKDWQARLQNRVNDPKDRDRVKYFLFDNVAPLAPQVDLTGMSPMPTVRPFRLDPSKNVLYPTADMAKALIDERTKPVKTTLVLADQPRDNYYVTVLIRREEKGLETFKQDVYSEFSLSPVRGEVIRMYRREAGKKAYDSVLALLKREFKYEETDEQKKKIEDREKRGGDEL